jgi:DNA-binding MarR family transcriptional regulator
LLSSTTKIQWLASPEPTGQTTPSDVAGLAEADVANRRGVQRLEKEVPTKRSKVRDVDYGPLNGHLGYLVRRLQRWIFNDFISTLAPFGLRTAEYSVLLVIEANPGLTQISIANSLGIERARLVHVIDALQRRDYVLRVASKSDRRSHALVLTNHGRSVLKEIKALAMVHEKHVIDRLGPERHRTLLKLLAQFADG